MRSTWTSWTRTSRRWRPATCCWRSGRSPACAPTSTESLSADGRIPVPRDRENDYTRDAARARQEFVREHTDAELEHVSSYSFDPGALTGNIEQFLGVAQVPIGL